MKAPPSARFLLTAALLGIVAWWLPELVAPWSRPLHLPIGPNDGDYVVGFRTDWEREGRVRFRWTGLRASIRLPVGVAGSGARLRMRVRRHLVEPARVSVRVEGRLVHLFEIAGGGRDAYRVEEIALPELRGEHALSVDLEVATESQRPLGVAVDWIEIVPGSARVRSTTATRARVLTAVLLAFAIPMAAGGALWLAAAHAVFTAVCIAAGLVLDTIATERIVRLGLPLYAIVGVLALALLTLRRSRTALLVDSRHAAGSLAAIVLLSLAARATLLLHPSYFYPDVRVHARFAHLLARQGPADFFDGYIDNQFRFSLGLQEEGGHWYAFPYPPGLYALSAPLISYGKFAPEAAVSLAAAAANALGCLIVFGLARRFGAASDLSTLAAVFAAALPLFGIRLALAYFPALVGHAVDGVVLLFLASRVDRVDRPRTIAVLAGLLALAMLTYTQALVNFAFLFGVFSLLLLTRRRDPVTLRRVAGITLAGALGLGVATFGFYGRYVPSLVSMWRGEPVAGESILLDRVELEQRVGGTVTPEAPDRFAADDVSVLRGLHKGAARLWIFYGGWSVLVVAGAITWYRGLAGLQAQLGLAWLATYPLMNLASGGLPNPNLLRYAKDLEFVAPAACIALATVAALLWKRGERTSRLIALAVALGFVGYGAVRWYSALVIRFAPVL